MIMKTVELVQEKLTYQMTEEINQLRANVQFSGIDKKVILITSAMENEGKSSIALELSKSFVGIGKTVLLLDADMRKSVLQFKLKEPLADDYVGLSHVLAGQDKRDNAIYQADQENLFVIFAGRVPPNPSELLSTPRMEELVSWAREQFDYVIIDCPPLNAVIDAAVIASYCDSAIVVIRADRVPYHTAQNVLRQLETTQCPIMGIVLNQVETRKQGYYYRHYYRKYGYGYGRYGGYGRYSGYGQYGGYGHAEDSKESRREQRKAARQEKAAAKKEAASAKKEAAAAAKKVSRKDRPRKKSRAAPAADQASASE